MKALLVLFFLIESIDGNCQVPEVEIRDSTFVNVVDIFLDSVYTLDIKEKTVVLITVSKVELNRIDTPADHPIHGKVYVREEVLNYKLSLSLHKDLSAFKFDFLPSFYFVFRQTKCYVSFNVEALFRLNDESRKAILKTAAKELRDYGGTSVLAGMEATIEGRKIQVSHFGH